VPVPFVALSDDLAVQQFKSGEQGRGAAATLFQGQARLGAKSSA
jgi:hypothetical protein